MARCINCDRELGLDGAYQLATIMRAVGKKQMDAAIECSGCRLINEVTIKVTPKRTIVKLKEQK